jgi:hypothetical protein
MKRWALLVLFMVGCAGKSVSSTPVSAEEAGQWAEASGEADSAYYLTIQIDKNISSAKLSAHFAAAAGDLCAEHGKEYFDLAPMQGFRPSENLIGMRNLVLCYEQSQKAVLNAELKASAKGFTVLKSGSGLKKGELLRSIEGKNLETLADLKMALFRAEKLNKKRVAATILRNKKTVKVILDLDWSPAVFGPQDRERFQQQAGKN